jgi:S-adenosylmethionine synthetase
MTNTENGNYIFTSESVSKGHPDKVADQISDAILDAALKAGDTTTRVACETLVTTNLVVLAGEVKNFNVSNDEVEQIVRNKVKEIGYEQDGFHWEKLEIINRLHKQSGDIALGTDNFGAGDQGIMFGYACDETSSFMPAPIHYSHAILKNLDSKRASNPEVLGPDAKSQCSIRYLNGVPTVATAVVVSTQHGEGKQDEAKSLAKQAIIEELGNLYDEKVTKLYLNPTGRFVIGGPDGDAGVTGRKIIVDTYGGYAPHGGGAFSGKDPTKVDRSAAYMARWLARQAVDKGFCKWATIQLSYAIGIKAPMAVYIDCNEGGNKTAIENWISTIDLTPLGIIRRFKMFEFTDYSKECVYGHFGDKNVPWEKSSV